MLVAQKNSASAEGNFLGNFHSSLHNGGGCEAPRGTNNTQLFHVIDKIALHVLSINGVKGNRHWISINKTHMFVVAGSTFRILFPPIQRNYAHDNIEKFFFVLLLMKVSTSLRDLYA